MMGGLSAAPGRRAALLHRDQEGSPTGASLASRPGGLSYQESIDSGRARRHGFMKHPQLSGGRRALDIKNLTDLKGILRGAGISEMPTECQRMLIAQISLILKIP